MQWKTALPISLAYDNNAVRVHTITFDRSMSLIINAEVYTVKLIDGNGSSQ